MANSTLDTMVSIIPVVIVGGMALKMLDVAMPKQKTTRRKRKKSGGSPKFGDFRNVGF